MLIIFTCHRLLSLLLSVFSRYLGDVAPIGVKFCIVVHNVSRMCLLSHFGEVPHMGSPKSEISPPRMAGIVFTNAFV